jgi:Spy/CpxP family protein refolding chaperone
MRFAFLATLAVVFASSAQVPTTPLTSPYAAQHSQDIKAISPDDVQAYLTGKGMGLAKAAELNGYPGPAHVLALATQLRLTEEQRARTASLFASMEANAISLGGPLVEAERALDRAFAIKEITPERLSISLERIADLQARLRAVHLEAHIAELQILTPEQVALYSQLRGYPSAGDALGHEHHQQ